MNNMNLKFNLTKRWRERILRLISKNDRLEVFLVRTGRNVFKIYAGTDGEKLFEMDKITLKIGDEVVIKDIQTTVSMDF